MLANLAVHDIVLIDRLGIDFDAGLTVLTGETGAGKSILLDALSLALGSRGDNALVRAGADRGQVTATFEPPAGHPVHAALAENGITTDGAVILRRMQTRDGKTRAFISDQPCSVALLREVGAMLVEIHGQHDDRALVSGEEHRRLLDAFGRLEADAAEVASRTRALRDIEAEAERLKAGLDSAEREADFLRAAVTELEALAPEPGEETSLAERRHFLMRAEKIAGDLDEAYALIGGDASPAPDLVGLARRLDRKSADMPGLLEGTLEALNAALDNLEEARRGLQEAMRNCEFDPLELERTEERLFALRAAARKYNVPVDDLPTVAAESSARLAEIDFGGERLVALGRALQQAGADYRAAARTLSDRRAEAASALEAAVNAELPALKLEAARFIVARAVDESAVAPDGFDTIAFHVRTNPGTAPGPLMKVASGGELSRFLLALKVALADRGSAPTLVFDEIDAGAGGAVAEAIGRRLARLAERVQVLSVTHAPQVAAHARTHLLISKSEIEGGARVATNVEPVAGPERREEIARMLAGATISDEARRAA
ncbi:MAG: DNA repair protein RecN, partial [Pseudomonadota bacterium]|nr:DNA repair protein RecN [Pseudomonadota bacterium]